MPVFKRNRLLVEGEDDKRVLPQLIEANGISWGETRSEAIVDIATHGGVARLLDRKVITTELKASGLAALGILVDANEDPKGRWQQLRRVCLPSIPDLPDELPTAGLVHPTPSGVAFGVWMMPDNRRRGMLESFLAFLVPAAQEPLWEWTAAACAEAREKGAPFKAAHRDKARIHTWLAFQDPPGRQLHHALIERILDPAHPHARTFVDWFRRLFDLRP